jgi:uncharacterized protein YndB with AHSA1/START domain
MEPLAQASVHIDAPPEKVYALVADLPAMGKWSPECVSCDWKGGATEARPGAKFKGRNRIGWRRWSTTGTVVTAEPGKELTFDISSVFGLPVARWRYVIDADNGGSRVTESMEDKRSGSVMKLLGLLASGVGDRGPHNQKGIEETLQKIKAAAEAS